MISPETPTERQGRMLQALSELSLSLAANLQARAVATEDDETAAKLAGAFQKVARSVRQCLALEARLERDNARDTREAKIEGERLRRERIGAHKQQVKLAIERLVWTEDDEEEIERVLDLADDVLAAAVYDPDFLDTSVEALVARMKVELGLVEPQAEPAAEPPTDPSYWQSSA